MIDWIIKILRVPALVTVFVFIFISITFYKKDEYDTVMANMKNFIKNYFRRQDD